MQAKRILLSIAVGTLLLVLFVAATVALSSHGRDNYFNEGPNTLAARRIELTYSWSFPVARWLDMDGLPGLALILSVPILAYSSVVFIILTILRIPRPKPNHETPNAETA